MDWPDAIRAFTPVEDRYRELQRRARLRLLRMHFESAVGHIGGNLSCLDLLLTLFHGVMADQDAFVLSKGHAAGALYVTLWTQGVLSEQDLQQFHRDGTRLSGHPNTQVPGVLFATGSLGHGLGLAAGLALGRKLMEQPGRVFCLTSDAEWNAGSTWEALMFARQHDLGQLTILIDWNGLQGFGRCEDISDLEPMSEKLQAFRVPTRTIDGHDPGEIIRAMESSSGAGPQAIIARTRKGCGVSFMENRMEWHYLPMTEHQYSHAVQEVEGRCELPFASP